jgi:SET domain-containing protein
MDAFSTAFLGVGAVIQTVSDAELRPSKIHGTGLFSTRSRPPGEVLTVLDGQEIDPSWYPTVMENLDWNALAPDRLLVRALRTSYGYINHSTSPNVEIDVSGRIMRTARTVAAGEELTMNYFAQPLAPAYLSSAEAVRLRG